MAAELLLPTARASDTNNSPYSGAKWKFYVSGTSTPQAVYADADLSTSLGSEVEADGAGKFVPIYMNANLQYRGVCENASGSVTLHDIDPINSNALSNLTSSDPGKGASIPKMTDGANVQQAVAVAENIPALVALTDTLTVGSTVRTNDGHAFEVAPVVVVDQDLVTDGGSLLYAKPQADGTYSLAQFYDGDASAALQKAIDTAAGLRIVVPAGTWAIKEVDVTGAWLEFAEGHLVTMSLGANENGFITSGGTRLTRPVIEVTNTATPPDGGLGNAITMGTYETDGDEFNGLEIQDGSFTCMNASAYGLAISCLGRCQGVRLRGTTTLAGRFAGGFQAHWGGEFDGDPHTADVTASYHPNDIVIDKLVLIKGGPTTLGGHLGFSLSAAYNVSVGTLINKGWDRTDWIQPGDVYDLVAGEDQADKIMSGIVVRYTEVIDPVQNVSGYNNVLVSGVSATIRTAGQTELVCAADRKNMHVDHGEIRFIKTAAHTYDTNPLMRFIYAKGSKANVTFEGFGSVTVALYQGVYNTDCDITVSGKGISPAVYGYGNIRNHYHLDWDTETLAGSISTSHRAITLGTGPTTTSAPTATVDDAATAGDTSITISAWTNQGSSLAIKGTRFYTGLRSFVTLSRSQMIGTGVTTIYVEPIPDNISAAATLTLSAQELDSTIDGLIVRAYQAIGLTNSDGVIVTAKCLLSAKNDIFYGGAINRHGRWGGTFDRCGQVADGAAGTSNIHLGSASVLSDDMKTLPGCKFEPSGTPLVASNVYGRLTNNAHTSLQVAFAVLNSTSHPVNYLWPTDATTFNLGPPMVHDNTRAIATGAAVWDFDIGQGACQMVGGVYHFTRTNVPSVGAIPASSRWNNPAAASGVSPGSVRTTAGTWIALPVL